jgi:hypothetical protein
MLEALGSFETSAITSATRRNIPEDAILHSHIRENLRSYIHISVWRQWVIMQLLFIRQRRTFPSSGFPNCSRALATGVLDRLTSYISRCCLRFADILFISSWPDSQRSFYCSVKRPHRKHLPEHFCTFASCGHEGRGAATATGLMTSVHVYRILCGNELLLCKIWGFHGGDYEECHLGYKKPR